MTTFENVVGAVIFLGGPQVTGLCVDAGTILFQPTFARQARHFIGHSVDRDLETRAVDDSWRIRDTQTGSFVPCPW